MCLQFHDITSWITVGDKILETYCIERPDACHVTCWIASEPGQEFSVNWRNIRRVNPMDGTIFINNVMCNQHFMLDSASRPDEMYNSVMVSSVYTSPFKERKFKFPSDGPSGEENESLDDATRGSIRLEIWNLQVWRVMSPSTNYPTDALIYGAEATSLSPLLDMAYAYRLGDRPFVTFTFNYAPRENLMAEGVIPYEPNNHNFKFVPYHHNPDKVPRQRAKAGQPESNSVRSGTSTRKQVRPGKETSQGSKTPVTRVHE